MEWKSLYFGALPYTTVLALMRRLLFFLLLAARLAAADPVLDTAAKVRALPTAEAARNLPAHLTATVIYVDRLKGDLFVRDNTAATYAGVSSAQREAILPQSLKPGARVQLDAITNAGGFFPDLTCTRIDLLGMGTLPAPRQISEGELFSPALDSQWVEVPAVVTGMASDSNMFTLAVEVYGWKLNAQIPQDAHSSERAAVLMQRPVRLQGVAGTMFNPQRQMAGRYFFVPSFDQIIPTDTLAPNNPIPLRKVSELLRSDDTTNSMARVAGVVTQTDGNDFYLRDESGSVMVRTAGNEALVSGDRVEAEGFAAIAPFRPVLRARKITVVGHAELPHPMTLDFGRDNLPLYQSELIALDADFLARRESADEVVLQCRMGDRFFEALLPPGGSLPKRLVPGDQLRLTGICELTTTHPLSLFWNVDGFRLKLPVNDGVVIVRTAPWWTLQRLFALLGVVSALALGALIWVWLLRRRVQAQTETIVGQRERGAVLNERQRIARELHDTVEQELSGLALQLGTISRSIDKSPAEAKAAVALAGKMLGHCRVEARASIRDLRGIELEQRGLSGALRQLLPVATQGCDAQAHLNVTGDPRPMAAMTETHLLRIALEAVSNAVRHAAARTITVDLDYSATTVTLLIRDDGCGFDTSTPAPNGHFGLLGIHERADKLDAELAIASKPGQGTSIRVTVPHSP
jgi:signal transduction histidine kinase